MHRTHRMDTVTCVGVIGTRGGERPWVRSHTLGIIIPHPRRTKGIEVHLDTIALLIHRASAQSPTAKGTLTTSRAILINARATGVGASRGPATISTRIPT